MAFHLPKEPIRTKREFPFYLLATAAGVAWWHTRTLVNEGRHNLALEIAENRKCIETWRGTVPQISGKTSLTAGVGLIVFSASAWKAAEVTGATAHTGYQDARGFAQLYSLQEELTRTQSNLMNDRGRTMSMHISLMDNLAKGLDDACAKIQKERSDGL